MTTKKGTSLMQALYSEHVVGALRGYTCSECNIEAHCPGRRHRADVFQALRDSSLEILSWLRSRDRALRGEPRTQAEKTRRHVLES